MARAEWFLEQAKQQLDEINALQPRVTSVVAPFKRALELNHFTEAAEHALRGTNK